MKGPLNSTIALPSPFGGGGEAGPSGAPVNTVAPVVTSDVAGDYYTGRLLTTTNGTWTNSPSGYTYQWERDGIDIAGATSSSYTLVAADEGTSINCTVTATNGAGSTAQDSNAVSAVSIMDHLFTVDGEDGAYFHFDDETTLWQDTAGTTAVTTNNDPVARADDQSGNGHNLTQATTTKRYAWQSAGHIDGDNVDDQLDITVPTGGWTGTMVIARTDGIFSFDFTKTAGTYASLFSGATTKVTNGNLVGLLFVDKVLSAAELAAVETYFVNRGATLAISGNCDDYVFTPGTSMLGGATKLRSLDWSGGTSAQNIFRNASNLSDYDGFIGPSGQYNDCWRGSGITGAPNVDLSNGTLLTGVFLDVSAITSLANVTWPTGAYSGISMHRNNTGLTAGPPTDIGNATTLQNAYDGCTNIISQAAGVFDNVAASCSCSGTWADTALDAASVNNVLVSLDAAGLASVTIDIAGSNAAPTGAGLTAKTNLQGRGCTVNTN